MNNVVLIGRLTKDPELTYTESGKAKVRFILAVKGFNEDDTDFLTCIAWNKTAESVANYVKKGHKIGVTGHIKTRSWESDNGRVYITEILCDQVEFLEQKKIFESDFEETSAPKGTPKKQYTKYAK